MKLSITALIAFVLLHGFATAEPNKQNQKKDTLKVVSKEIVVSALRYPEIIQEVPMSISLINKEDLLNIRGVGIEEPLNLIPGVLAQSRSGYTDARITIRGFGARGAGDRSNSGTSRGIKFFLDGIPLTEPDGRTSFDEIDFALANKVEVVRSNASTIWGNAAGGVVSISTMPFFIDDFLTVSNIAGSYGLSKQLLQAGIVTGESRMTLGFTRTSFDGYRKNSESEKNFLQFGFSAKMSPKTTLGVHVLGVTNEFNIPGPLTKAQFDSLPEMANTTYESRRERRFNRLARMGITLDHELNANNRLYLMTFVNPKFLQRSERNTFRDFTRYHIGGGVNWVNTMKLSESIKNTLLIGADEQYQDGAIQFFYLKNGERDKLKTNKREGANTAGIFIQDELNFGDNINILLGARYDNVTYYSRVYFDAGEDVLENNSEDKVYTHVTPKIALSYRLNENHTLFANMGGGIEVPAGNETDPAGSNGAMFNRLLEPIVSTTFELGDKVFIDFGNDIFNYMINELSVYYIDTKNELIPYDAGAFYLSAGKTSRIGIEWGLTLNIMHNLTLRSALTYSVNKYSEYKVDSAYAHFLADYKDNEIAGIPSIYYNTSLRWEMPFLADVFAEIETQSVGSYFSDDANKYEVPSFNIINAKIGLGKPIKLMDGLGLGAFAAFNNLTDAKYAASAFINPDLDKTTKQPLYLEPGLPTNFVLGISLDWK